MGIETFLQQLMRRGGFTAAANSLTRQADPTVEIGPAMAAYRPSKSFPNAVTVAYARQFAGTNIPHQRRLPGAGRHRLHRVTRSYSRSGRRGAIRLATLPDGGPTGSFFEDHGIVPW